MRTDAILFGSEVIQRLLPHRHPFLMVDAVLAYARSPRPSLRAARQISVNEAASTGHLPGLHLWPSAFTLEGIAQSCGLIQAIAALEDQWIAQGRDPDEVIAAIRNMDLGYRLNQGYRAEASARLAEALATAAAGWAGRVGITAAIEIEILAPVSAGEQLEYAVIHTDALADIDRFEVEALVRGRPVARGALRLARIGSIPRAAEEA